MVGFYVFMLIMTLLIPATMLFWGYRWQVKPPEKINQHYGYRTRRSMSSKNAWKFAHKHCGKTCVKVGWFTLIISVLCMAAVPVLTLDIEAVSVVSIIVVALQCVPFVFPLITTESALKREFGI